MAKGGALRGLLGLKHQQICGLEPRIRLPTALAPLVSVLSCEGPSTHPACSEGAGRTQRLCIPLPDCWCLGPSNRLLPAQPPRQGSSKSQPRNCTPTPAATLRQGLAVPPLCAAAATVVLPCRVLGSMLAAPPVCCAALPACRRRKAPPLACPPSACGTYALWWLRSRREDSPAGSGRLAVRHLFYQALALLPGPAEGAKPRSCCTALTQCCVAVGDGVEESSVGLWDRYRYQAGDSTGSGSWGCSTSP